MSDEFYNAFLVEIRKVKIEAFAPATAVLGACLRAAKRAQMVVDGEEVAPGPWVLTATSGVERPTEGRND